MTACANSFQSYRETVSSATSSVGRSVSRLFRNVIASHTARAAAVDDLKPPPMLPEAVVASSNPTTHSKKIIA